MKEMLFVKSVSRVEPASCLSEGGWFDSPAPHAEVSLSLILNLKQSSVCECMYKLQR